MLAKFPNFCVRQYFEGTMQYITTLKLENSEREQWIFVFHTFSYISIHWNMRLFKACLTNCDRMPLWLCWFQSLHEVIGGSLRCHSWPKIQKINIHSETSIEKTLWRCHSLFQQRIVFLAKTVYLRFASLKSLTMTVVLVNFDWLSWRGWKS